MQSNTCHVLKEHAKPQLHADEHSHLFSNCVLSDIYVLVLRNSLDWTGEYRMHSISKQSPLKRIYVVSYFRSFFLTKRKLGAACLQIPRTWTVRKIILYFHIRTPNASSGPFTFGNFAVAVALIVTVQKCWTSSNLKYETNWFSLFGQFDSVYGTQYHYHQHHHL